MNVIRVNPRFFALLLSAITLTALMDSPARLAVSGDSPLNRPGLPLLFTWNSILRAAGAGWTPGESVRIYLHGPLNSLAVFPARPRQFRRNASESATAASLARGGIKPGSIVADLTLTTAIADDKGNLSAAAAIPYDAGDVGLFTRIPRPGFYEVRASGSASGTIVSPDRINLCPATNGGGTIAFDWGQERGGREGVLPGDIRQFSPERFDPEWPSAWDEFPVELYGTIPRTGY